MSTAERSVSALRGRPTSTREAVETAIDLSKGDKSSTWESHVSKEPDRITGWGNAKTTVRRRRKGK